MCVFACIHMYTSVAKHWLLGASLDMASAHDMCLWRQYTIGLSHSVFTHCIASSFQQFALFKSGIREYFRPHIHFEQFIPISASLIDPWKVEVWLGFHGLQNSIFVSLSFPGNPGCLQPSRCITWSCMIMHVPAKVLHPAILLDATCSQI